MGPTATPPPYAPNVVNQTVSYGGATWKGNPGGEWTLEQPSGGTTTLMGAGAPTFDLVAATDAAYGTPEIKAAQKTIADRQAALVTAQTNINDNPFYSEATRVGKQRRLDEQAQADITVQKNILNSLKTDAAIKVNAQKGQYDINNDTYKTNLNNFNNLVAMGGLDGASDADISVWSVQTGIPTSMIKSIQGLSQRKNAPQGEKPQILTSTDNNGNLSILAVDGNGKIINQTQIPGVGKADKASGGSGVLTESQQLKADKERAPSSLAQDVRDKKMTLGTAMSLYLQYGMSKQQIYDIYLANTGYKQTAATRAADKARYGVK